MVVRMDTVPRDARGPQPDVAAALARRFGQAGLETRIVQTHVSWVLLAGAFAWKLKKPVRFGFLDYSSVALRRHACEEELRLNRRLAPWLYLDVVPVRAAPDGPTFDGDGPPIDWAVRMHRLPDGALASERLAAGTLDANRVNPRDLNDLDRRILKESFRQARKLQRRLALDYKL